MPAAGRRRVKRRGGVDASSRASVAARHRRYVRTVCVCAVTHARVSRVVGGIVGRSGWNFADGKFVWKRLFPSPNTAAI